MWKNQNENQPQQQKEAKTSATSRGHIPARGTSSKLPGENRATVEKTREKIKWASLTDPSLPVETRLNLARQISRDLSQEDVDLLFELLRYQPASHNREHWWVVMNEIIEQMRRKGVAADRLGNELIALVKDTGQSEVSRDYAVQHLSLWVAPPSGNIPAESSPETRVQALDAIAAAITDPSIAHTSIPGTALMALTAASSHLAPEMMAPVWEALDPAMSSMLKGETRVPLSTRTTVIQSVAMRGSTEHLPLVQSMARDEKINPSMRLSSIAALGVYRSESDRDYLTSLTKSKTRYRYAAQSALKKLSQ